MQGSSSLGSKRVLSTRHAPLPRLQAHGIKPTEAPVEPLLGAVMKLQSSTARRQFSGPAVRHSAEIASILVVECKSLLAVRRQPITLPAAMP